MNSFMWYDESTRTEHWLQEEGQLFRWTAVQKTGDSEEPRRLDFGLVPGGVYAAVWNLYRRSGI